MNCTPWSTQGSQLQWLHEDSLSTIAWAASLRQHTPHVVMIECTPLLDREFISILAGNKLAFHSCVFGPGQVGIPVSGKRLWMAGVLNTITFTRAPFSEHVLGSFAFQSINLKSSAFARASRSEVKAWQEHVNSQQLKLPPHPRGKRCRFEDISTYRFSTRLESHRCSHAHLRANDSSLIAVPFFYDISQNPHHACNPSDGGIPRPLCHSLVWAESEARALLPRELWCAQGNDVGMVRERERERESSYL